MAKPSNGISLRPAALSRRSSGKSAPWTMAKRAWGESPRAARLRAAHRACRTIVLRLRFDDYNRATRSRTLAEATTRTATILSVARGLLRAAGALIARRGLTLIGVALTNLCDDGAIQLVLPFDRTAGLDRAVDTVRERFGTAAIARGALVGRDAEPWVPLLPD